MVHNRTPVRPHTTDEVSLENAYPNELLVNKATGEITYKKADGTTISNKNPGSLIIKSTDGAAENPILENKAILDLHDALTLTLGKVAFSNDYNDLLNKPSIPDASAFLPIAGGTMTGSINFNDISGGGWSGEVIGFKSNEYEACGIGIVIGGSGLTIVGGGDAAQKHYNYLITNEIEDVSSLNLHLVADKSVIITTNYKNANADNRKKFIFDDDGNLTVPGYVIGAVKEYNGTISTAWVGSAAPYYQDITVNGIAVNDKVIMDIKFSGTYANDKNYDSNWAGNIYRAECTAANTVRVYSHSKLTIAIPVHFYVSR